jgi:fucose permease
MTSLPNANTSAQTATPQTQAQARWATRMLFFAMGAMAGTWGVHVPSVKSHFVLDELALSWVLLAAGIGALLSLAWAGRVVAGCGVAVACRLAGFAFCSSVMALLWLPNYTALLLAAMVYGAATSLFDVAINAEGIVLEGLGKRAVLSGFHGMWSVGGMCGAGASALLLRSSWPVAWQLVFMGFLMLLLLQACASFLLPTHPAEDPKAHSRWPNPQVWFLGFLLSLGLIAEGVVYDWAVLYMKQELGATQSQAAWAYISFAVAMASTRFGGDALRARFDEMRLLRVGACVSALAMCVVLWTDLALLAVAAFAFVGAGIAIVVPVLYNAATHVPGVSRAAAVASVSAIGFSGFLMAPPLVGAITHASGSLPLGMSLIVVAAVLLAVWARRPRGSGSEPSANHASALP